MKVGPWKVVRCGHADADHDDDVDDGKDGISGHGANGDGDGGGGDRGIDNDGFRHGVTVMAMVMISTIEIVGGDGDDGSQGR